MGANPTPHAMSTEIEELKDKLATAEAAILELTLAAGPLTRWKIQSAEFEALRRAVGIGRLALKEITPAPGVVERTRQLAIRAETEAMNLRDLADAADAERRDKPGYRPDLEG